MVGTYTEGDEPVPGFRLVAILGWGRFGEVWKAAGPGGIEVALKIIPLGNRQGSKEFRAIRLVKQIRHPNLVPIQAFWLKDRHGRFVDDSLADNLDHSAPMVAAELIIAMGLGEQSLFERFEHCRAGGMSGIPPTELLRYLEDAARGIDYLNGTTQQAIAGVGGIQHCDIKPHNILLVGGVAQICDLGVARLLEDTRVSSATGSAAYIAPEFIRESKPSRATDQYSLAISYVEMRTGALPFNARSAAGAYLAHLEGKLDLSRLLEPEQAVIARATALSPDERHPSCSAMVEELKQACGLGESSERKVKTDPALALPKENVVTAEVAASAEPSSTTSESNTGSRQEPSGVGQAEIVQTMRAVFGDPLNDSIRAWATADSTPELQDPTHYSDTGSAAPQPPADSSGSGAVPPFLPSDRNGTMDFARAPVRRPRKRRRLLLGLQLATAAVGVVLAGYTGSIYRAAGRVNESQEAAAAESTPWFRDANLPVVRGSESESILKSVAFGDYDLTVSQLTKAIRIHPGDAQLYLERAFLLSEMSEYERAIADCTEVLRLKPRTAAAYHCRALAALRKGDASRAIADCTTALQCNPQFAEAYYTRSLSYQEVGDFGRSVGDFTVALQLRSGSDGRGRVTGLAFSPNRQRMAVAATELDGSSSIRLWDHRGSSEPLVLPGKSCLAFSPDGRLLASGGKGNTVLLFDLATGSTLQALKGHTAAVTGVAFSPDGFQLASAAKDGTIRIWRLPIGKDVVVLQHGSAAASVAFSPNGRFLASSGDHGTLKVWEVASQRELYRLRGHSSTVSTVAFRQDGRYLASGSYDRTVRLWDVRTGKESFTLRGHGGEVTGVAFNPDGLTVASSSADLSWPDRPGQLKIWDARTGKLIKTLGGQTQGIMALAYLSDGRELAAASTHWQVFFLKPQALPAGANRPENSSGQQPLRVVRGKSNKGTVSLKVETAFLPWVQLPGALFWASEPAADGSNSRGSDMARRFLPWLLPLYCLAAGCHSQDQKPVQVPNNPFGQNPAAESASLFRKVPSSVEAAARADSIARKLELANKQLAVRVRVHTIGSPHPEIFHQGASDIFLTDALVTQCKTDAQLAAVLASELGKMVSEREAAAGTPVREMDRTPPMEVRVGNDYVGAFGSADQVRRAELAKYEQQRHKTEDTVAPDPKLLAKSYLTHAGYPPSELDAVEPLLKVAADSPTLARQIIASPSSPAAVQPVAAKAAAPEKPKGITDLLPGP